MYEDANKDFVIEAGVLKEYHGASQDVIIPNSVYRIESSAFSGMKLHKLTITSSIPASNLDEVLWESQADEICIDGVEGYFEQDNIIYGDNGQYIISINGIGSEETLEIKSGVLKLSRKACGQVSKLQHLYVDGMDLMNMPCNEKAKILSYQKNGFFVKCKHSYRNGKCNSCNNFDTPEKTLRLFLTTGVDIDLHNNGSVGHIKTIISDNMSLSKTEHINDSDKKIMSNIKILYVTLDSKTYITENQGRHFCYEFNSFLDLFPKAKNIIFLNNVKSGNASVLKDLNLNGFNNVCFEHSGFTANERNELTTIFKEKKQWKHEDELRERRTKKYIAEGKCQHCGGEFNLFKKCKSCGRKKDY